MRLTHHGGLLHYVLRQLAAKKQPVPFSDYNAGSQRMLSIRQVSPRRRQVLSTR